MSITRANAKHHIVNHLVCDVFVWDARFQDAPVANSDTNARRLLHFESILTDRMSQLRR